MHSGNVHGGEQGRHLTNHLQSLLQIPNGVRIFRTDRPQPEMVGYGEVVNKCNHHSQEKQFHSAERGGKLNPVTED